MTSRTYGIFKSSCRVKLDTYRGALVIMRRIFDCAFCSIAWLDLLAQPHISIPYVQNGFIIVLIYKTIIKPFWSLFSIDSCNFLPSSQYISFTLSSICFLFTTMWSLQLSLWSKCMPKYFVTAEICYFYVVDCDRWASSFSDKNWGINQNVTGVNAKVTTVRSQLNMGLPVLNS